MTCSEKTRKWYLNIPYGASEELCTKYFPETPYMEITWEQVEEMYKAEQDAQVSDTTTDAQRTESL